jgi:RND family efflux transporter MFP subunit
LIAPASTARDGDGADGTLGEAGRAGGIFQDVNGRGRAVQTTTTVGRSGAESECVAARWWPRLGRAAPAMLAVAALALAGCRDDQKAERPVPRPVKTIVAAEQDSGETVVLTGRIEAQDEASIAFRIGGRMTTRFANVGDKVEPDQVLAILDPQNEMNTLRSAETRVNAAEALVTQTRAAFERQRVLLAGGHTPRAQFDLAEKALSTALAQLDDAEAQRQIAADRVGYTILRADAAGTVTARGAEAGEVVQAGQMIVQIARQGGRDAVFDVPAQVLRAAPADPKVTITLTDDRSVNTVGRVREIAPQADPVTRTFAVRIGLTDPPVAMRLGSTVNGTLRLASEAVITIPASALTELNRQPAVWIVEPKGQTVSLRNIEMLRFDPGTVVVSGGLHPGDIVVTAGVQALHPGQEVRLLGPAR